MTRVLCIAAHPDDEILGPGGTLARHVAEGDEVTVHLSHRCRQPSWATSHTVAALMHVEFIGEHDIDELVAGLQPEIVYTHHAGDLNAQHRALHERVLVACRPYTAPSVRSIRTFDTSSSTEWGLSPFTPNLFVDIEPWLDRKLDAMELYGDELRKWPHPRSVNALSARASYWGSVSGFRFAEPFMVVRERW